MLLDELIANKFILNQIFFNFKVTPQIKFFKHQKEEFWSFLGKYLEKAKQYGQDDDKCKYEQLISQLGQNIPEEWTNLSHLQKQLKSLEKSNAGISLDKLLKFRNILLTFVDFNLKRKEKKLEKLIHFQSNLPIYQYKETILEKIQSNSVVLIAGDTGCGKSTQVPQYLLRSGFEKICCTQPRRIACIALRDRLAHETADEYGSLIGYQIRFEAHKTKSTKILFLTEGLLLRQMIEDPLLSNYQVIILDEIHERHLSSDFLLGAIKCLLHKRKHDLKVILMSATVNCELFSNYFGKCVIIQVPGRLYPIKTEYVPIEKISIFKWSAGKIDPDPYLRILQRIDSHYPSSERGDVLVFLSGFAEIETVGDKLRSYAQQTNKWIILYLHSALPITEQNKVFDIAPDGVRKCILSTNIAETSITIDGIRFVVDSGKVKEIFYESKMRMNKLQEIWISKASAVQRRGRAGRTGPGVCYRLYSQKDYDHFEDYSKPEIQRVSLESLVLNMIAMGLNDVRKFPFIERPNELDMENCLKCLINYGAIDSEERITYLGRILSKLPVDIPIGKMLILSVCIEQQQYALSVAASLSAQSFTTIRSKNDIGMIEERKPFVSYHGDLFSNLNFYKKWLDLKYRNENTYRWCRKLGLEEQRFHEVTKLRRQFEQILKDTHLIDLAEEGHSLENLTKEERITKHAERKAYKRLKHLKQTSTGHNKRRLLNVNPSDANEDADDQLEPSLDWNLKELEFNLQFDCRFLEATQSKHSLKKGEVELIKLIIMLGFYPQMAIADPDNSYEMGSELIFHLKDKPFVLVHPSSVYCTQPDILKCDQKESSPLGDVSTGHTLLAYMSFIETSKSYICNCMRIPALHALLLSAQEVDTTEDCQRIVCDDWILIQFPLQQDSQQLLITALSIREKLSILLRSIFECTSLSEEDQEQATDKEHLTRLKEDLLAQMGMFMRIQVKYSIKRLLAADLKTIYTNRTLKLDHIKRYESTNKLVDYILQHIQSKPRDVQSSKGGIRFDFINWNCLKCDGTDTASSFDNRRRFHCEKCLQELYVNPIEQVRHTEMCLGNNSKLVEENNTNKEKEKDGHGKSRGCAKLSRYFCKDCDRELTLSHLEILRHRKSHCKMGTSMQTSD